MRLSAVEKQILLSVFHTYPLIVSIHNRQYRVAGLTAGNTDNSMNYSAYDAVAVISLQD